MSAYKSYTPRRSAESTETFSMDKLKDKVDKIQELFPNWSAEDLHSVLIETNGDVELAVARISEGHAEQWGSVTRKKDKKTAHQSATSSSRGDRDRPHGDSRGGRGGRGGRGRGGGGSGRGGRGTGAANRPRDSSSMAGQTVNGTITTTTVVTTDVRKEDVKADGAGSTTIKDLPTSLPQPLDTAQPAISISKEVVATSTTVRTNISPEPVKVPELSSVTTQNGTQHAFKAPTKISKVQPGTTWAQIARAPEKLKQPAPPPPSHPSTSVPPLDPSLPVQDDIPSSLTQEAVWEEPTTAEAPPWDDEPVGTTQLPTEAQVKTQDGWIMAESISSRPSQQDTWDASTELAQAPTESPAQKPEEPITAGPSPSVATTTISVATSTTNVATSTTPTSKPSTPSVSSARPAPGHRASARYPKTDQPVVIPAFAGNIGASTEKLGMQFGSLSLGAEDNFESSPFKPESEPSTPAAPEATKISQSQQHTGQPQVQAQTPQLHPQPAVQVQPQDAIQPPITSSVTSQPIFQQQAQTTASSATTAHVQTPVQTPQVPHHQVQQASSGPSFGSQAPVLGHQQQQPLVQPQQPIHGYASQQHSVHSQFDGQLSQQSAQHAPGPQSGTYFRQTDSPYYHNPTPPQSAPPEHQAGYAAFSPLGPAGSAHGHTPSLGGQGASGHLGGFGTGGPGDYGYSDNQRGFYDYQPPNSFSTRLGHDEPTKGGLPLSQPNQSTGTLGASAGQPQGSNPAQASSGQPPAGQQGQQGYPHMPYYYPPYYQNSYPTYPNPSYGQYMPKYPPVYPHQGPIGPGSAPPPSGKGPGSNTPYNASASQSHLYHNQGAFDDPSAGYQHHQGSTNLGAADYSKQGPHQQQQPLYGGQAGQGLQSFLGMQQSGGPGQGVGGPGSAQRSNANPEAPYKQYGGAGSGNDKNSVGIGSQPNQQGRTGGIQPTQQQGTSSFYPGGRFGSATGGPQQQGQQQGQGYPQTTDQSQFYPYQPRHQGGYWQ